MTNENPDLDKELMRWIDLSNARGHAHSFAAESAVEKEIVERSIARDWAVSMEIEYGISISQICSNNNDPPDCVGCLDGIRVSIEVTEFVNEKLLEKAKWRNKDIVDSSELHSSNKGDLYWSAQWEEDTFRDKLKARIEEKSQNYQKNDVFIDYLVVATDERWLRHSQVESWLQGLELQGGSNIKEGFFLMGYDPNRIPGHSLFKLF